MTFPVTPNPIRAELLLSGGWLDITALGYVRDGLSIIRGRSDEQASVSPAKANITINNRNGNFSPRNPSGPYYGQIGRNTRLRIGVTGPTTYLNCDGTTGAYASTPDTAALDNAGDIDLRVDMSLSDTWGWGYNLLGRFDDVNNKACYLLWILNGQLVFCWSSDGVTVGTATSNATIPPVGARNTRIAVRVAVDINNGSGSSTFTFYTAPNMAGSWTQFGDVMFAPVITGIFAGSGLPLRVGACVGNLGLPGPHGQIYAAQVRNLSGTLVANPDFTAQSSGATSFTDSTGLVWTTPGTADITNIIPRFVGEIGSFPQKWDTSERDAWCAVEAGGILRRLGQGNSPLRSSFYGGVMGHRTTDLVAYWPMEDGAASTQFASAVAGAPAMVFQLSAPTLSSSSVFVASAPAPVMIDCQGYGKVRKYAATQNIQFRALIMIPTGTPSGQALFEVWTTGNQRRWVVTYVTGGTGNLSVTMYDAAGVQQYTSGTVGWGVPILDQPTMFHFAITSVILGSTTQYTLATLRQSDGAGAQFSVVVGGNSPAVDYVILNPAGGLGQTVMAHVHVRNAIDSIFTMIGPLNAWNGERAVSRMRRVCADAGIPMNTVGRGTQSALMGPQPIKTVVEIVTECAVADMGILHESKDCLGIEYRTMDGLLNQSPAVVLSYSGGMITDITPLDDDSATRNEITVTRSNGSSVSMTSATGPLSDANPPIGVGAYQDSQTLNLYGDIYVADQAGWRLRLGTVDEPRYPSTVVALESAAVVAGPTIRAALLQLDPGDVVQVADTPAWIPPGGLSQVVQGYTETLEPNSHRLALNLSPASPWRSGMVMTPTGWTGIVSRVDTEGTTLSTGYSSGATSLTLAVTGAAWDPAAVPFDVMCSGERMTVTAITGAYPAQVLTVTRSVNGVVKSLPSGASVNVAETAYVTL
jgi:hypothetical protein